MARRDDLSHVCDAHPALCLFAVLSPFTPPSWAHVLFISTAVIIVIALMTPV
jgi:hypothetical protein